MYKLIALDMDGTLLTEDKIVSERTKKAIENARNQGKYVVLCSGRPIEGINRYLEELGMTSEEDYVISFNGAIVQHAKSREVISRNVLSGEDLHYLYNISKELGVNIHAFSKYGCITPKMSTYSEHEGKINGIPVIITDYNAVPNDEEIVKIMLVDDEEILEEAIKKLPQEVYEKYTVVRSAPFFTEYLNKDANKGTGVEMLAKHLGIKRDEVICVGDAGNDIHMIEYAGLGVAMGNAFPEVKEIADYITASNEDDGVAEVIEKFMLK